MPLRIAPSPRFSPSPAGQSKKNDPSLWPCPSALGTIAPMASRRPAPLPYPHSAPPCSPLPESHSSHSFSTLKPVSPVFATLTRSTRGWGGHFFQLAPHRDL